MASVMAATLRRRSSTYEHAATWQARSSAVSGASGTNSGTSATAAGRVVESVRRGSDRYARARAAGGPWRFVVRVVPWRFDDFPAAGDVWGFLGSTLQDLLAPCQ